MKTPEVSTQILDLAIKGDQQACRTLIDTYKDFVYKLAFQIVKSHEDAEEVSQDSFVRALKYLKSFNRKAKFSTWLYRITYNTAISKIRKKKLNQKNITEIEDYKLPVSTFETSLTQFQSDDQRKYLYLALEKLKDDEKALISLYYLKENSMEEVAEITGLKVNNVKVKIHRARQKLYKHLSGLLHNEIDELL